MTFPQERNVGWKGIAMALFRASTLFALFFVVLVHIQVFWTWETVPSPTLEPTQNRSMEKEITVAEEEIKVEIGMDYRTPDMIENDEAANVTKEAKEKEEEGGEEEEEEEEEEEDPVLITMEDLDPLPPSKVSRQIQNLQSATETRDRLVTETLEALESQLLEVIHSINAIEDDQDNTPMQLAQETKSQLYSIRQALETKSQTDLKNVMGVLAQGGLLQNSPIQDAAVLKELNEILSQAAGDTSGSEACVEYSVSEHGNMVPSKGDVARESHLFALVHAIESTSQKQLSKAAMERVRVEIEESVAVELAKQGLGQSSSSSDFIAHGQDLSRPCVEKDDLDRLVQDGLEAMHRKLDLREVLLEALKDISQTNENVILDAVLASQPPHASSAWTKTLRSLVDTPLFSKGSKILDAIPELIGGYNEELDQYLDSLDDNVGKKTIAKLLALLDQVQVPPLIAEKRGYGAVVRSHQ